MTPPVTLPAADRAAQFKSFLALRELRIATDPRTGVAVGYRERLFADAPGLQPEWVLASGRASLLSFTIYHLSYAPEFPVPYNVVEVALEEGPTLISTVVKPAAAGLATCPGAELQVGMALEAHFDDGGRLVFLPRNP